TTTALQTASLAFHRGVRIDCGPHSGIPCRRTPISQERTLMDRRHWLKSTLLGSGSIGLPWLAKAALGADDSTTSIAEAAQKGTPPLRITDIKTTLTAPANIRLVVVRVLTNEPGL